MLYTLCTHTRWPLTDDMCDMTHLTYVSYSHAQHNSSTRYMKASCRTREWVTSQRTWLMMGHLHMDELCRTRVNESWHTYREVTDDVPVVPPPGRILILGDSRRFLIDAAVLMRGPVCHDLTMVSSQYASHCIYGCSVGVCVCCYEVVRQGKSTWNLGFLGSR